MLEVTGISEVEEQKIASESPLHAELAGESVVAENAIVEEKSESDLEQEARAKGWRPDGPKSAEEFLRAEPLYEEIKSSHKEIRELKAAIKAMKDLLTKQEQKAYEKALNDIRAAKVQAIEMGNVAEVDKLDNEIKRINDDLHHVQQQQNSPKVQDFLDRNASWLQEQSEEAADMRLLAQAKHAALSSQGKSDEDIVDVLEATLRKAFPSRFEVQKPNLTPRVEAQAVEAKAAKSKKGSYTLADLNSEQKEICRYLTRSGTMTQEQYINELVKLGELQK